MYPYVEIRRLFMNTHSWSQLCDVERVILTWFSSAPRHWSMPFKPTTVSVLLWNMLTEARWDLAPQSHGAAQMSLAVSGSLPCSLKQTSFMPAHLLSPLSALFPHVAGASVYGRPGAILRCGDCLGTRVPPFTWCCVPRSKGDLTLWGAAFYWPFLLIMSIWPPCVASGNGLIAGKCQ